MSKQVVVTLSTCALATSFLVCAASAQTVSEVQLIPLGTGSFGAAAASLTSTPVSQASGLTAPYHTKRDVPFQFAPPVTQSAVLLIPNPKPQRLWWVRIPRSSVLPG
jgi:hypothetical protein